MDTEYDFTQTVNTTQLLDEIRHCAGLVAPDYISTDGTAVSIFYVDPLSDADEATLSTVVANHVANPNYVPMALQTQITRLTGYLHSTTTSVQPRLAPKSS